MLLASDHHAKIERDKAAFMKAAVRVPAYKVAQLFNSVTRGVNWIGCSKTDMADHWAKCRNMASTVLPGRRVKELSLRRLKAHFDSIRIQS